MDTLNTYRRVVQEVLEAYYQETAGAMAGGERQLVLDPHRDHYLLMTVGWDVNTRVDSCILHLDIKDGQIWIQHDGTERGIANDLVARGIPKTDIVLAFHAPYKRPYTGFGVGRDQPESQAA
jgi:hypothetical protein